MYYTIIHTIGIQEFIKIDDTKCKFRHVKVSQNIFSTINHQPSTSKSISPQQNMEINEHIEDLKKKLKNIFHNTFRKKEKNRHGKLLKTFPMIAPKAFDITTFSQRTTMSDFSGESLRPLRVFLANGAEKTKKYI